MILFISDAVTGLIIRLKTSLGNELRLPARLSQGLE
jgi:hypothetical protein